MAFGSDNDIKIVLTLDSGGVVKELKQVGGELEKLGDGAEKSGKSVSGLQSVFSSVGGQIVVFNQALDLVQRTFGIVSGAAQSAFKFIERGSAVADVSEAFGRLATQAGTTARVFQEQLTKATGDTIANFDLQKKAIESLRAGVKPDEFITLTQAARALAEQTGGSTADALNELSTAFETGRVRGLQNKLGILDLTRAEEELAKQLGISREELSAEGQVLAARNALLEASALKVAEVGTISADAGDLINQFSASLKNAADQAAIAISSNQALNETLVTLNVLVKEADFSPLINAFSLLIRFGGEVAKIFTQIGTAVGDFALEIAGEAISNARNKFAQLRAAVSETIPVVKEATKNAKTLSDWMDEQAKATEKATEATKEDTQAKTKNIKSIADLNKQERARLINLKEGKIATEATSISTELFAKKLGFAAVENEMLIQVQQDLHKEFLATTKSVSELSDEFNRLNAISSLASLDFSEFAAELRKQTKKIQDAIEQSAADALRTAFEGGKREDYKEIAKNLGGQLGSVFGPIGQVLGEKAGEAIFDGIAFFFGDRNEQGKVRDSLDAFFGEILKDNPALVIFQNELKQIFDLDFLRESNAFTDGTFDDTLQGLSTSAIATFDGIALAFAQFVEGATEQATQLSAILANNLGGSLNNLQLFVQATGMSFEKLREQIVEAFLDGKLTADEALNSLSSIQQIAEKGIPGALGAVDQAFNNLKASGEKGGRAIIDALQDIGSEARELGVKDFGTLANVIREKTGASAEEVQKLFDALTAAGITSIDQLENATVEQLLPAISNLSKAEFPFSEAADSVQGLIDQVNRLPDRIEKKLVFNVETRADRASQQLIDKGAIPQFGNAGEGT